MFTHLEDRVDQRPPDRGRSRSEPASRAQLVNHLEDEAVLCAYNVYMRTECLPNSTRPSPPRTSKLTGSPFPMPKAFFGTR